MFEALVATGERLMTEPGVRVVVLSGEGPDFCAGLDWVVPAKGSGDRYSSPAQHPPSAGPTKAAFCQIKCWHGNAPLLGYEHIHVDIQAPGRADNGGAPINCAPTVVWAMSWN